MRVLVLGGDGMLGHQLLASLSQRHDVRCTLRQEIGAYEGIELFTRENSYFGVDARSLNLLNRVFADFRPEGLVNCVGIVKQRPEADEAIPSLEINALLPHRLAVLCREFGCRLVHLSTDCVFSGSKGNYRESDSPDAHDLYGRTKCLGEVSGEGCITLRTSIIGRELRRKTGLLEWFLSQKGTIKGFTKAIFSGFTTIEMARIIEMILVEHSRTHGLYHVSSEAISKFDLLVKLRDYLAHDVEIEPDASFECDRSLDSSRFRREFQYAPPGWDAMSDELRAGG